MASAASVTSSSVHSPIPIDIRAELPDPFTPWTISKGLFDALAQPKAKALYKKAQIFPITAPQEWRFIWRYFHHDKPLRYGIKAAYVVFEKEQRQAFEHGLSSIERDAEDSPPTWNKEARADQRARAIARWKESAQIFSPFVTHEANGRTRNWTRTKVIPLWHGTSEAVCELICKSGFTFFGKQEIPGAADSTAVKSTDDGYFGSGMYFTNSARYAADIYSRGHLLMGWVAMREPFPVVGNAAQSDMNALRGRGAYKNYNTHYVPVTSANPLDPFCAEYLPLQVGQEATYDEYVVFQRTQALPQYWVELEPELPHLITPGTTPEFVSEFLPYLKKVLQNPQVDRDAKLRNFLNTNLSILMQLQLDDDLTQEQIGLYEQMRRLFMASGSIDKAVRNQMIQGIIISPQPAAAAAAAAVSVVEPVRHSSVKDATVVLIAEPVLSASAQAAVVQVSFEHLPSFAKKTYPDGSVYEGQWKNGKKDGQGRMIDDNKIYEGQWKNDKREGKGKEICSWAGHSSWEDDVRYEPQGEVYEGQWKNDEKNGQGTYVWNDSFETVYTGSWKDGQKHGKGKVVYRNGAVYEGEFNEDKVSGRGKMTGPWGQIYEGSWRASESNGYGVRHGHGKMIWPDLMIYEGLWEDGRIANVHQGSVTWLSGKIDGGRVKGHILNIDHWESGFYIGELTRGCRNGQGVWISLGTVVCEGEWKDGKLNGQGKQSLMPYGGYYSGGEIYEGQWKDGRRHGQGRETNPHFGVYEGEWYDDVKKGKGRMCFRGFLQGGDIYEGQWDLSTMEPQGKYTFANGRVYEGQFNYGNAEGHGRQTWPDGRVYVGQHKKNYRDGQGKMTWPDGRVYEGQWEYGKMHGQGKLTLSNGVVQQGLFQDNVLKS